MARVKVYLYEYFDRVLKRDRRSTLYATADAIAEQAATIIAESERLVDEDLLNDDGTIAAHRIPLPEEVSPARSRSADNDLGAGPR